MKVVHIELGSVSEPAWVSPDKRRIYFGALTAKGQPNRRNSTSMVSVNPYWHVGYRICHYAPFDAEREAMANVIRANIKLTEAALERAKDELFALYAGPKPASNNLQP